MTTTDPAPDPFVDVLREWLAPTSVSDTMLDAVLAAERDAQERICRWGRGRGPGRGPRPPALDQALMRRVARALAARGVALGVISSDTDVAARLPRWDAEIERYEAPYRVVAIA